MWEGSTILQGRGPKACSVTRGGRRGRGEGGEEDDNPSVSIRPVASRGCPEIQEVLPGREVQVGGREPQALGSAPVALSQPLASNRLQCRSSPPFFTEGSLLPGLELGMWVCDLTNPHSPLHPHFTERRRLRRGDLVAKGCTARQEQHWEGPHLLLLDLLRPLARSLTSNEFYNL